MTHETNARSLKSCALNKLLANLSGKGAFQRARAQPKREKLAKLARERDTQRTALARLAPQSAQQEQSIGKYFYLQAYHS